jgi:hypothetical protein
VFAKFTAALEAVAERLSRPGRLSSSTSSIASRDNVAVGGIAVNKPTPTRSAELDH